MMRLVNAEIAPVFLNIDACEQIKNMPTVEDAEIVVHCKKCKHWLKDVAGCTDFVGYCEWANWMVGENGYCIYGEL